MAKRNDALTAEQVRFMFNYNPAIGDLTWKNPASNPVHAGQQAGSLRSNGRKYVSINNTQHLAHRIVWLHHYGSLPDENIVAKNGDYADLRIDNFFTESVADTAARAERATNTSGIKGVSWDKSKNKWQATITRDYKQVHLGRFDTKEAAGEAYEAARREAQYKPPIWETEARRERSAATRQRVLMRRLWKRTIKENGGSVGWTSYEEFSADIGTLDAEAQRVVPKVTTQPVGHDNFELLLPEPKFDYRTPEGKLAYNRAHRAENRDHYKNSELKRDFGITLDQYSEMLEAQNGVCAICKKPETEIRRGKLQTLSVDHCHRTGHVRALLCGFCNRGVGYFKDDPVLVRAAADYLEQQAERLRKFDSNVIPLKPKAG